MRRRLVSAGLAVGIAAIAAMRASAQDQSVMSPAFSAIAAEPQRARRSATPSSDHVFGVGIRVGGSNLGVGGTVRYFPMGPLGVQGEVSQYSPGRSYASTQFNGELLYRLDEVRFNAPLVMNPYFGGGISIIHSSFSPFSDTTTGVVVTGGVELFFQKVPRLGVSGAFEFTSNGDFNDVRVGGPAFLASAHYYLK